MITFTNDENIFRFNSSDFIPSIYSLCLLWKERLFLIGLQR